VKDCYTFHLSNLFCVVCNGSATTVERQLLRVLDPQDDARASRSVQGWKASTNGQVGIVAHEWTGNPRDDAPSTQSPPPFVFVLCHHISLERVIAPRARCYADFRFYSLLV